MFQELIKILLKHGVNVNKPLSAGKNKVTPLMIAAGKGNLEIVRLLVQNGAVIEQLGIMSNFYTIYVYRSDFQLDRNLFHYMVLQLFYLIFIFMLYKI